MGIGGLLTSLAFAVLLVAGNPARAMSVSPILTDMAPAGRDSRSTITVVNTGTTLPVEIVVNRLELGENGDLGLTPTTPIFSSSRRR